MAASQAAAVTASGAAGLSGHTLEGPAFAAGYETAILICVLLTLGAAAIAAVTISTERHADPSAG